MKHMVGYVAKDRDTESLCLNASIKDNIAVGGLDPATVVQTVNDAVSEGIVSTGVEAGLILCTLRHYNEAQSLETIRLAEQFKGTHVLGFDIAGDEVLF